MHPADPVSRADETTSIQARRRGHPSTPPLRWLEPTDTAWKLTCNDLPAIAAADVLVMAPAVTILGSGEPVGPPPCPSSPEPQALAA